MPEKILQLLVVVLLGLVSTAGQSHPARANAHVLPSSTLAGKAHVDDPGGPTVCPGQSKDHIHKWFTAKWGLRVPLRCGTWSGTKGYGLRKLVAKNRWNPWFKAMIAITLSKPYSITDEGSTKVYRTRTFFECTPNYHSRVIVQTAKIGGTKRMRGIITAYQKFE